MTDLPLAERGRLLSELAATLATLPAHRAQTWRLGEALRRMLEVDGVAITVEYLSDSRTTLCASDEVAEALESLQEVMGEGPGFEAARNDAIVVADLDGDADQRWPMLARALEQRYGPLRVYAVPLHAGSALAQSRRSTPDTADRWPSRRTGWPSWPTRWAPPCWSTRRTSRTGTSVWAKGGARGAWCTRRRAW